MRRLGEQRKGATVQSPEKERVGSVTGLQIAFDETLDHLQQQA